MNRSDEGIRGLVVPHASKDLLNSEYADDAMLYLHGNDANVHKAEGQMDLFCKVGELIGTKVEDSG